MSRFDAEPGRDQGCRRGVVWVGAAGVLLLFLFLLASARLMERSLGMVVLRARQRVIERLPADLPAAQRQRTLRNLDRLVERNDRGGAPVASSFLGRVSAALEDDRLTASEVDGINLLLEGTPAAGTAVPANDAGPQQ